MPRLKPLIFKSVAAWLLVVGSAGLNACGDTGNTTLPVGKGTDLRTTIQFAWESTFEPLTATSDKGLIYVIWNGKAVDKPAQDAGIPDCSPIV